MLVLTSYILIFSSEVAGPNTTKLGLLILDNEIQ